MQTKSKNFAPQKGKIFFISILFLMNTITTQIKTILEEKILSPEHFVIDILLKESRSKTILTIILDGDKGITIDACAQVSRALGEIIEEQNLIQTAFNLEISSPGVETPLKNIRQIPQHIGRNVEIVQKDLQILKGKLIAIENQNITIEKKDKPKANPIPYTISYSEIEKITVLVSFH